MLNSTRLLLLQPVRLFLPEISKFMLKALLTLSLGILFSFSYAQTFTFSDTYPINNLDSLEQWLKTHPQPTVERLKNLIRAERTIPYTYPENMGKHLSEIKTLSARLHSPVGQTTHTLLSARVNIMDDKRYLAFEGLHRAYNEFVKLKDTSGIIQTSAGLVSINYGIFSKQIGDNLTAEDYLKKAESLHKIRRDIHDSFPLLLAHLQHVRGGTAPDYNALLKYVQANLQIYESHPECAYVRINTMNCIESCYQALSNYKMAYQIDKQILAQLKPDQLHLRIRFMFNLSNSCVSLNRHDERLRLCEKALVLYKKLKKPHRQLHYHLYKTLQYEYARLKDFKKAYACMQELVFVSNDLANAQQSELLIELTKRYQAAEKQKQIAELTLQKTQTENRNRLILILLGVTIAAAVAFGFLGLRLRRANTRLHHLTQVREQLFGIVAHDLRRPMFAFQNIKALVSFHLRKQNYAAIETLSTALDESGIRLQKMLDNLVAWAMSQQEKLPYQPQNLPIRERVQTIVELYSGVNLLKNIHFEVTIPETLMTYADPNAFDLMVRNLIDNSYKALAKDGSLRISTQVEANEVQLLFEDNAPGMSAETAAIIRRVFDAPEKAQIGENGMGMGLIMVGRFVKRNRGRIDVESVAGQGTTFRLWLPKEA